jgi:hypothetical protein
MTPDPKSPRKETQGSRTNGPPNWRDLAQAAATEQDPAKVLERARELIRALDAESQERMENLPTAKHRDKAAS